MSFYHLYFLNNKSSFFNFLFWSNYRFTGNCKEMYREVHCFLPPHCLAVPVPWCFSPGFPLSGCCRSSPRLVCVYVIVCCRGRSREALGDLVYIFSFSFSFFFFFDHSATYGLPSHNLKLSRSCSSVESLTHCAGQGIKPKSQHAPKMLPIPPVAPQQELWPLLLYVRPEMPQSVCPVQSFRCIMGESLRAWLFLTLYSPR